MKVISIVGKSNSGKTTLIEKVIRELTKRGYRIGTIKHDTHGFEIDYPGKDSYRHFHSGAEMTMILGPDKAAVIKRLEKTMSLSQALDTFFDCRHHQFDLIITDGFKKEKQPKIEVVRKSVSAEPICRNKGDNLVALVSDFEISGYTVPRFHLNKTRDIVNFIERTFL